jgi:hypothetical protein
MVELSIIKILSTKEGYVKKDDWKLQGTYQRKEWNTGEDIETTNVYGFAAKSGTNRDGETISAGEFVRAHYNVGINTTRAYLQYIGEDETLSKSAVALPDHITVVFVDGNAETDDDNTEDIKTPTSEINPNSSTANVWSFDKTIYLASAPNTPYMIVDINGRPLLHGITATDRDEIHLSGKVEGVVIVVVGGKSFKIRY